MHGFVADVWRGEQNYSAYLGQFYTVDLLWFCGGHGVG